MCVKCVRIYIPGYSVKFSTDFYALHNAQVSIQVLVYFFNGIKDTHIPSGVEVHILEHVHNYIHMYMSL